MAEHDEDGCDTSETLPHTLARHVVKKRSGQTSAQELSCRAFRFASLLACVGVHLVLSVYEVSKPTVVDDMIYCKRSILEQKCRLRICGLTTHAIQKGRSFGSFICMKSD